MANLKATARVLQIRDGMVIWFVTGTCILFASTDCLGDLIKLEVLPGEEAEEPLDHPGRECRMMTVFMVGKSEAREQSSIFLEDGDGQALGPNGRCYMPGDPGSPQLSPFSWGL